MKKLIFAVFAMVAVLAFSPAAKASSFDYGFFGTGLDSTLAGSYSYTIGSNGYGTAGTLDITTAGVNFPAGIYTLMDSQSFSAGPITELVFQNGGTIIDVFNLGNGSGWQIELNGNNQTDDFLTVYGPEPSSLVLLGSGLLVLAIAIFWKSRSSAATAAVARQEAIPSV